MKARPVELSSRMGRIFWYSGEPYQRFGRLASYKKADLVNSLLWFFDSARAAAEPTPAQRRASEWLPDVMRFPAVDPDASARAEEEAAIAPWADAA